MRKVSPLGFIIIAIVVAEIFIFIPSSRVKKELKPDEFVAPSPEASLSIQGFHAVNLNEEGRKETIDAEEAELYQDRNVAILKHVETRIFTKGDSVIHIQGREGKYHLNKKDMEFMGDIVATSENQGYQLKTESLNYIDSQKLLSSDNPVWIGGPNPREPSLEVTGIGLRAYTKTETLAILNNVHCNKYDVEAERIEITSNYAEIYLNKNQALFKENVLVKQKDMNIFSDRFFVTFNSRNKAMDEAKAFDNVKIVQGERVATCNEALLLNREGKIVLTGNPKVVQGQDTVEGKKVIFFTRENKILFDEAKGEMKGVGDLDLKK